MQTTKDQSEKASDSQNAAPIILQNGDKIVKTEHGFCLGIRTAPGMFDGWEAFETLSEAVAASGSKVTIYFELKCKDTFGDVWSTGRTFPTLNDAKAFVNGTANLKDRQAARRSAESLAGVKFSLSNPCSWQVDQITLS